MGTPDTPRKFLPFSTLPPTPKEFSLIVCGWVGVGVGGGGAVWIFSGIIQCIPCGVHLILVEAMWPSINQWQSLFSWLKVLEYNKRETVNFVSQESLFPEAEPRETLRFLCYLAQKEKLFCVQIFETRSCEQSSFVANSALLSLVFISRENPRWSGILLLEDCPRFCWYIG